MPARRKRTARRRKVGLALGAGGARGIAHIGVLRALRNAGISVDAVVGTSVGALVGAVYAAGQLEAFERWVRGFDWSDVLRLFDPVWPRSGLISGSRALERLSGVLGDWQIEDLTIPFAAVAVDLITGEEVLIREGRVMDAIRASISLRSAPHGSAPAR
jgi:NTE family protein